MVLHIAMFSRSSFSALINLVPLANQITAGVLLRDKNCSILSTQEFLSMDVVISTWQLDGESSEEESQTFCADSKIKGPKVVNAGSHVCKRRRQDIIGCRVAAWNSQVGVQVDKMPCFKTFHQLSDAVRRAD